MSEERLGTCSKLFLKKQSLKKYFQIGLSLVDNSLPCFSIAKDCWTFTVFLSDFIGTNVLIKEMYS
jgi:hypothetical protein